MQMKRIVMLLSVGFLSAANTWAYADIFAPEDDAVVYQGAPGPMHGSFPTLLAAGFTGSGHDSGSVIRFDLTSLNGQQIESAKLHLYAVSPSLTGFPGSSPTPSATVTVQAFGLATQAGVNIWQEETVSWTPLAPAPAHTPIPGNLGLAGSVVVDGIDEWFQIDITSLAQSWLDDFTTNNGLRLSSPGPRVPETGQPATGVFASREFPLGENDESYNVFLEVTLAEAVPEPSTLALAGIGVASTIAFAWRKRRQIRKRSSRL